MSTTTANLEPRTAAATSVSARARAPRPVRTHLVAAVLCALFCFAPLGVAAVVHAGHVRTRLAIGDLDGAHRSSRTTARLCWASVLVTVGCLLVFVICAGPYSETH
jgi:ABC-type Fe3+ transport system permease subunit